MCSCKANTRRQATSDLCNAHLKRRHVLMQAACADQNVHELDDIGHVHCVVVRVGLLHACFYLHQEHAQLLLVQSQSLDAPVPPK
jgi:hypothetical protein